MDTKISMMIHAVVLVHGILLGADHAHREGNRIDVIGRFLSTLSRAKMILKKKKRVESITDITVIGTITTGIQVGVQVKVDIIIHNV